MYRYAKWADKSKSLVTIRLSKVYKKKKKERKKGHERQRYKKLHRIENCAVITVQCGILDWILKQKKDISGKTGESQIKFVV